MPKFRLLKHERTGHFGVGKSEIQGTWIGQVTNQVSGSIGI